MKALILAAGYATRLYPLTKEFPKPLLLVNNKPIIDYIIDKLDRLKAVDEIIVVTNSKFFRQFKAWKRHVRCGKKISLVDDLTRCKDDRRGAIGDTHFAIREKNIKSDIVIIGGDNIFNADLDAFLSFANIHKPHPAIGIYDCKRKSLARQYGVVGLDAKNIITDFQEKPQRPRSTLVAMCLYYFPKEKLSLLKTYLDAKRGSHDAMGLYIDWLRKKEKAFGFLMKGNWFDIGQHQAFKEAKKKFNSRR